MTPQQALEVLKQFQDWRTSKRDNYDYSPKDLTQALNIAIEVMEKHIIIQEMVDAVRNSLNLDKTEGK